MIQVEIKGDIVNLDDRVDRDFRWGRVICGIWNW